MPTPDPDHPIILEEATQRWRALYNGHVLADTGDALILRERGHAPVVYFPRQDVEMGYMSRSDRSTHCPFKGEASYYTVFIDGDLMENTVWTYEEPLPDMELIRGRLAFYTDDIKVYAVDEAQVNPGAPAEPVDEVVQHTDAGDGHSQRERWSPPPDVRPPEGI